VLAEVKISPNSGLSLKWNESTQNEKELIISVTDSSLATIPPPEVVMQKSEFNRSTKAYSCKNHQLRLASIFDIAYWIPVHTIAISE
jgi:hypothetical protein